MRERNFFEDGGFFFESHERLKHSKNEGDIEFGALAHEDGVHIQPIPIPCRKCFVDDEILGRAGGNRESIRQYPWTRTSDTSDFKVQSAQGDVDPNTVLCPQEQHPSRQGKFLGVGISGSKASQQIIGPFFIMNKTSQQADIRIVGETWFAPSLNSGTSDKTKFGGLTI